MDEWCEYCKCAKCNPMNKYVNPYYQSQFQDKTKYSVNLDLLLGFSLLAISGFMMFYGEEVYIGFYSTAYVATAIAIRAFFTHRIFEFSL
jgi:hypothetical protein